MRVGILTYHRSFNYGGSLQALCLRRAIESLGYEVDVINFVNKTYYHSLKIKLGLIKRPRAGLVRLQKQRAFRTMTDQLVCGPLIRSSDDINFSQYDRIVVGSDVVWDWQSPVYGSDPVYFGAVPGAEKVEWIAYAASCGKADPTRVLDEQRHRGLSRFRAISVRDQATQDLVESCIGSRPPRVLDPTWLGDWEGCTLSEGTRSQIAVYGYGQVPEWLIRQIRDYARRKSLEIVSYGFIHPWADRNVVSLPPLDWVKAISEAHAVVTTTFHGTLYAIKTNRPFVLVDNQWSRSKVKAPLELADCHSCRMQEGDSFEQCVEKQLNSDLSVRYSRTRNAREASMRYLSDSLS